jgi:hypothetical protein
LGFASLTPTYQISLKGEGAQEITF